MRYIELESQILGYLTANTHVNCTFLNPLSKTNILFKKYANFNQHNFVRLKLKFNAMHIEVLSDLMANTQVNCTFVYRVSKMNDQHFNVHNGSI